MPGNKKVLSQISKNMEQYIHKWLLFSAGAVTAYMSDIIGVVILFLILFIADFISGCMASFLTGNKIESYRLRWSFVKTFCYFGTFVFTVISGLCLNKLPFFINIMKLEVYVALWIEAVSITENLIKIFPRVIFLEYIHFMISTEWVKKISGLTNFLKEKGEKK